MKLSPTTLLFPLYNLVLIQLNQTLFHQNYGKFGVIYEWALMMRRSSLTAGPSDPGVPCPSTPFFVRSFNPQPRNGRIMPSPLDFQTFPRPFTAKPVASHLYAESFPSNTCITNDQKLIVMHGFETNTLSILIAHNMFVWNFLFF